MKYHKNVPMKSSLPKKLRWILTRNMTYGRADGRADNQADSHGSMLMRFLYIALRCLHKLSPRLTCTEQLLK